MIPVLSRAQIRAFDARAAGVSGVPGIVLMENAGRGATEHIVKILGPDPAAHRIVIVCGIGNNGGDGFVIARHLRVLGIRPVVLLCGALDRCSGDARTNCDAFVGIGGAVHLISNTRDVERLRTELRTADMVVDALFGTGLDRPITGLSAEAVAAINASAAKKVAIDIPSGLDSDTGAPLGPTVHADFTITFALPKLGLLTPSGATHAGEVIVSGIGVPNDVPPEIGKAAELLERSDVAQWLVRRRPDAHKYDAGHVGVLGGSAGKVGAALLAAHGALRAGAGAATIVTWPEAATAIEGRVVEAMCARIDRAHMRESLDGHMQRKAALVVGPGFGLDEDASAAVFHAVRTHAGPVVLDADALTCLATDVDVLRASPGPRILTPHAGELGRLLGATAESIEANRFTSVTSAAHATTAIVVLKGAHTLIADATGRIVVGPRGTAALATAGSGDVLAGVIAALTCAMPPFEAACAGVWLHAAAGDLWAATRADRGMLASTIADNVPELLGQLFADRAP
jgi:NAD(P)H-hydrate epimerase